MPPPLMRTFSAADEVVAIKNRAMKIPSSVFIGSALVIVSLVLLPPRARPRFTIFRPALPHPRDPVYPRALTPVGVAPKFGTPLKHRRKNGQPNSQHRHPRLRSLPRACRRPRPSGRRRSQVCLYLAAIADFSAHAARRGIRRLGNVAVELHDRSGQERQALYRAAGVSVACRS